MNAESAVLFKPSNAIRGISDAKIQYYLKQELDTITFEVLDAEGNPVPETGSRNDNVTGTFFHLIAEAT
jgi:hypothetical protein